LPERLLLPAFGVILFLWPKARSRYVKWASEPPRPPRPVWHVAIGWLSLYCAFVGLYGLAITYPMDLAYAGTLSPPNLPGLVVTLLPDIAMAAMAIPAVATLKRRPSCRILNIVFASLVIASLAELFDAPMTVPNGFRWLGAVRMLGVFFVFYAVVLLVWFNRPSVRKRIAGWRKQTAEGKLAADERANP